MVPGLISIERNKDAGRAVSTAAGISFLFLYTLEAQIVLMWQPAWGLRVHKDKIRRLATEPDTPREGWRNRTRLNSSLGAILTCFHCSQSMVGILCWFV